MKSNYKKQLKNIKAFVFDVDGVLTNGGLIIYPNGKFLRQMNAKVESCIDEFLCT